jgi:acetoacetyl-CoA synthetase
MSSQSLLKQFEQRVSLKHEIAFPDFEALHAWSVQQLPDFWEAVWDFEGVRSRSPYSEVLADAQMPGAIWFPGAELNYAHQVFGHVEAANAAGQPAIIAEDERGIVETLGWPELRRRVASLACELGRLGVTPGDRVAAYLPNRVEAIIALLASASIGAIWTVCAPDMGAPAILDRFRQIEPKILIATDGVYYAGKAIDRSDIVQSLIDELPTLEQIVHVRSGHSDAKFKKAHDFERLIQRNDDEIRAFEPLWLPFDHPLWILFSSGTTGKPKAIVHGHGGIILHSAAMRLHWDLRPSYAEAGRAERFHWFSSTGWMMWNVQLSGLLSGTTICIYDGSPSGAKDADDWAVLWRFAARNKVTLLGSGAAFFTMCMRAGVDFSAVGDLSALGAIGSTASPLPADVQRGISERLGAAGYGDHWWLNSSGGTDICGAFCSANRDLPPAPGKIQCRQLGAAIEAWDPDGKALVGEVGELVCVKPMPSMPLYFWGDDRGTRYRDTYFDFYPGVWRHGDWVRIDDDGTCEIFGRSDATINRGGHRMGTSEMYDAIEAVDGVRDSLVVDVLTRNGESQLLAFVVAVPGLDAGLVRHAINAAIRTSLSPRFVPDRIYPVSAIPRTLSNKKQELPIKRLFEGRVMADIVDPAAMANPESLDEFATLAAQFRPERERLAASPS